VVFSAHRDPVLGLAEREGWACILGGLAVSERRDSVARFQAGALNGLACTIGSMQESANLSNAKNLLFLDLDFNPAANAQAMARGDSLVTGRRAGIYILVARGTVDERVMRVLAGKTKMIRESLGDRVLSGTRRPPPKRELGGTAC
jgi:DNA helicase INO80